MLTALRLAALKDNYMYLLCDAEALTAAVVDPSEAAPVEAALARLGLRLTALLCTHHHHDHTGGNQELVARHPGLEVYGSDHDWGRIPGQTHRLRDGDRFALAGEEVRAMHIPGHTLGAIGYVLGGWLFSGDTLFGAGCGRLFEGTPAQMQASLARLRALPGETLLYCGHEYTRANLRFAATVEPHNARLAARLERARAAGEAPTVPSEMAEERETNPFLRWDAPEVMAFAGASDPVEVFAAVRRAKDGWRG